MAEGRLKPNRSRRSNRKRAATVSDDPNGDLIGQSIMVEGMSFTVTKSTPWSLAYVELENHEEWLGMIRPAAIVRRHLQLEGE